MTEPPAAWRRRVGAYGLARDPAGRVLLVPAGTGERFTLPGGTVAHGESPQRAVTRWTATRTGLTPQVRTVRAASSDHVPGAGGVTVHHDRLVFDLAVPQPPVAPRALRPGARWFTPDDLATVRLPAYAADVLGLKPDPADPEDSEDPDDAWTVERGMAQDASGDRLRVQRFSAYARATDPGGRILLARIAPGYPSAGRWHLPGGGTDAGESPAEAVLREVAEETAQSGHVGRLLTVSHRHNPVARGWEGYPINWHTIRVVYEMTVEEPTEPRVTEAAGSTVAAAWMRPAEVDRSTLTDLAAAVL